VRYRPVKGALLRKWLEAGSASRDPLGEYITKRNEQSLLIINVESIPAMERLDERRWATTSDASGASSATARPERDKPLPPTCRPSVYF
jgi:hypothetical protein